MCDVDNEKPFVCPEQGCGTRFTNEDHLNVHMKKHEMSLALNPGGHSGSPALNILDQTPTPTKFLKNCEEMGLFQELSKNPFEEAFKKASDADGVPIPGPQSNELNTPVPPPLIDKPSVNYLLHDHGKALQSPTSSSATLLKDGPIVLPSGAFALDLSGQEAKENVSMQPSSTTTEAEEVSVISLADSTQSPSRSVSAGIPLTASKEVVVTQAVSSSLPGNNTAAAQMILASPATTAQTAVNQHVLTTTTAQQMQPSSASPSQGQQSCTMQVYLQLPTGQTLPVHIPATFSTVLPAASVEQQQQQQQQTQEVSATVPWQSQATKTTVRQVVANPPAPVVANSTLALKQRLKQTLQAQQQQQLGVVSSSVKSEPHMAMTTVQSQVSPLMSLDSQMDFLMDASDASNFEPASKRSKNGSSDSEDPDERRRKFLERNRAAAARCRSKRKQWISNLERKAEELQLTNNRLQSEVSLLRGEVAQLKTLLLAHQDCPITLQQKSQGQLALHTISMVESSSGVPFDVTQLVNSGSTTTVTIDGQEVTAIPVVTDSSSFTLTSSKENSAK